MFDEYTDYRNTVILFCGICKKSLEVAEGKHTLYLRCPCYERKNRTKEQDVCMNRISKSDANRVYDYIEGLAIDGNLKKGISFKLINIEAIITDINDFYIAVEIINRHKVKKNLKNKA